MRFHGLGGRRLQIPLVLYGLLEPPLSFSVVLAAWYVCSVFLNGLNVVAVLR
jgi:hypothetical protein